MIVIVIASFCFLLTGLNFFFVGCVSAYGLRSVVRFLKKTNSDSGSSVIVILPVWLSTLNSLIVTLYFAGANMQNEVISGLLILLLVGVLVGIKVRDGKLKALWFFQKHSDSPGIGKNDNGQ